MIPTRSSLIATFAAVITLAASVTAQGTPPPIPAPGQTVTWTAAGSPYLISGSQTIPATGVVQVEAGVSVALASSALLEVRGDLFANGNAASPVTWAANGPGARIQVWKPGSVELVDNVVSCALTPFAGARFRALRCTFQAAGRIDLPTTVGRRAVLHIEDCVFDGTLLRHGSAQALVRGTSFLNGGSADLTGYLLVEDVSSTGAALALATPLGQDTFVDRVTVTGNASGPGLLLYGGSNFLLGPNNVIQGNLHPIEFGTLNAGLLPGSIVPATGNAAAHVWGTTDITASPVQWADVGIPYVVRQFSGGLFQSGITASPGAVIEVQGGFDVGELGGKGLPGKPITVCAFDANDPWAGLTGFGDIPHIEYVVVEGAERAIQSAQGIYQVDNAILRDNLVAAYSASYSSRPRLRSTQLIDNGIGIGTPSTPFATGTTDLSGATNPNSFVGNGVGIQVNGNIPFDARNNWWGDASGPMHATDNPNGQGDSIPGPFAGSAEVIPWRTAAPDYSDHPPVVRLLAPYLMLEPGARYWLHWSAFDDGAIVDQEVRYYPDGQASSSYHVLATALPAGQHSLEWTVPPHGLSYNGIDAYLRVVARDDQGQEGWDEARLNILDPSGLPYALSITTDLTGPFSIGDPFDLCWSTDAPNTVGLDAYVLYEADGRVDSLGGSSPNNGCLSLEATFGDFSTDSARVLVVLRQTLNLQRWYLSEPIVLRPDAWIGDAPPNVQMSSPALGASFTGGDVIPVRWTATDDEGLRSFDLQASYDGGRSFHDFVRDLPGSATAYDWQTPASDGVTDLRIRVIARDLRYQNGSSGADASLSIRAGGRTVTSYCGALANSTGAAASIGWSGSTSIAENTFELNAANLPAGQPGLFYYGPNQIQLPFGDGLRCVGGGAFRLQPTLVPNGAGQVARLLDFTQGPPSTGPGAIAPGDLVNFQYWYRDPAAGMSGFNLTDGLAATFAP